MRRSSDFEHKQDLAADLVDACAQLTVEGELDWRRAEVLRPAKPAVAATDLAARRHLARAA